LSGPFYISIALAVITGLSLSAAFIAGALPQVNKVFNKMMHRISIRRQNKNNIVPAAIKKRWDNPLDSNKNMPGWLSQWAKTVEPKLSTADIGLSVIRYMTFIGIGGLIGFSLGIVILKNIPAALLIAISTFLLPEQYIASKIATRREKCVNQLGPAVRIFYAEFNDTPQVERALLTAGEKIKAPLGPILHRAGRQLSAGHGPDQVFANLSKKLDFYHGRMFAQLLRQAYDNSAVAPLFSRLATKVSSYQQLSKKNRSNLAYQGIMARLLNVMILPVFLLMQYVVPETTAFLIEHTIGRIIVTICFASMLVGILIDRMLVEVQL